MYEKHKLEYVSLTAACELGKVVQHVCEDLHLVPGHLETLLEGCHVSLAKSLEPQNTETCIHQPLKRIVYSTFLIVKSLIPFTDNAEISHRAFCIIFEMHLATH